MEIKGQPYAFVFSDELFDAHKFDKDIEKGSYVDGYVDVKKHLIYLYVGENNTFKTTTLHELTHAFLYESGLKKTAENEILCDWLAGNIEEILKKYKEIEEYRKWKLVEKI